jgi:hypothetical protein
LRYDLDKKTGPAVLKNNTLSALLKGYAGEDIALTDCLPLTAASVQSKTWKFVYRVFMGYFLSLVFILTVFTGEAAVYFARESG